jgi:hypothetical protein
MNENVFQQSMKGIHETMKAAPAWASRRAAVWDIGNLVRTRAKRALVNLWPVALSTNAQHCLNMLPLEDYQRYGRQMILDGFGLPGELQVVPSRPSTR